ncbi:MAG: hypothetical protein KKB39_02470 [Nanoarchaeota archaeon]|nr:hypothetical protein [Nanoarchaeota archaeon]
MLDFFKKLFKGEEKEKIDFFELTKWLLPKLDLGFNEDFQKIKEISNSLSKALENLEAIDIKAMQVEERLKGFVLGNRKAYILSLNTFRKLLEQPEKLDSSSIKDYCNKLQEEMTIFSKKTTKNFYIMQNLIGKELEEIRKKLNELTNIIKDISKKTDKLELIENIIFKLKEIYDYIDEKETRNKFLLEAEEERNNFMQEEKELKNKIENFKKNKVFLELIDLKQKRGNLENNLYTIKSNFTNKFAYISRPLRKLSKMYMDKLIDKYLDNPFSALFKDENLEIVNLLESLNKEMNNGKISEKNQDKILILLAEINKEYFESVKSNFQLKEQELVICNEKIEKNTFDNDLQKLISHLKVLEEKLLEIDEKIERFKEKAISQDIEKIEQNIKKLGFNIEVENAPYDS